jgi:AGAP002737-PA
MYFNEDIDISKIKTWKDVQNLRRGSENDFKELRDTFGYTGNKVNERIAELIFQYNEKVRLRREFYEGKSVDKNLILGTADSKKVDQIDKEMEDSAKKAQEARHAYLNSKEFDEERARFRKEAEEEAEAKEKAEKEKEEELKKAEEEAKEKAKAEMAALVGGKNNVYKDASKGNNNNTSSTSTSTGKYNNPEPVKTPPNKPNTDDNKTNSTSSEKNNVYKGNANKTDSNNTTNNEDSSSKNTVVAEVKDLANKTSEAATAAKSDTGKAKQLVNQAEGNANKIVENVKNVKDKTFLERLRTSLEAKIKKCDQSLSELKFDKGIATNVLNAIKWVFIKIKQILMKIVKAIVSALASIHNKFR